MNFRERQLRQISQNQIKQKETQWDQERQNLQQDIINLQNSTDIKVLEQTQAELKKQKEKAKDKQKNINDIIDLLGSEANSLSSITNLLKGQTLKELSDYKISLEQKIKDQDTALVQLAKQKLAGKKEFEKLLNELETNFKEKEQEWEKEKEIQTGALAQSREIIASLEKEKQELSNQIKTLNADNDELVLKKNRLIETNLTLTNDKRTLSEQVERNKSNILQAEEERKKITQMERSQQELQQIITQLQEQNKELEKDKKLLKNELKEWKLMLDKK